jgi:biopolymer transport protein ExbB
MTSGQNVTLGTLALRSPNDSYFGWKRSSEIIINTTSSGAGTSQDLIGFPLLVHLDSTNFNFLQALPSGADIRFSKTDGKTALPYEIERWDAVTHKADIWVRVDTLKANSRNQGLIMFWGNSVATDSSTSGAIFDTSLGFSAVYHLGEAAAIQPNGFKDATANKNHGTGISLTTTSSMQGIIGKGQFFNGNSQFIEVPDSPSLKLGVRDFTLSAWVRADTLSHNHQIASKRTIVPADFEFQLMQNGTIAVYPSNDSLGPDGFESRSRVGTADWHYIVFTRQGLLHSIYLDGVLDTADTIFMHDVASSANLRIGQDLDGMEEYWNGMIDDLTISVRARSADWIKMCYKNQLPGNTILEFKR